MKTTTVRITTDREKALSCPAVHYDAHTMNGFSAYFERMAGKEVEVEIRRPEITTLIIKSGDWIDSPCPAYKWKLPDGGWLS